MRDRAVVGRPECAVVGRDVDGGVGRSLPDDRADCSTRSRQHIPGGSDDTSGAGSLGGTADFCLK